MINNQCKMISTMINNQCKMILTMINNKSILKMITTMKHLKQYLIFKYTVIWSEVHSLNNNEIWNYIMI